MIANKKNVIDLVNVGHPLLNANIRYLCLTFGIIEIENLLKRASNVEFGCNVRGDLNLFREKLSAVELTGKQFTSLYILFRQMVNNYSPGYLSNPVATNICQSHLYALMCLTFLHECIISYQCFSFYCSN